MEFEEYEITLKFAILIYSHIKGNLLREQWESSVAFATDYVIAAISLL